MLEPQQAKHTHYRKQDIIKSGLFQACILGTAGHSEYPGGRPYYPRDAYTWRHAARSTLAVENPLVFSAPAEKSAFTGLQPSAVPQ